MIKELEQYLWDQINYNDEFGKVIIIKDDVQYIHDDVDLELYAECCRKVCVRLVDEMMRRLDIKENGPNRENSE